MLKRVLFFLIIFASSLVLALDPLPQIEPIACDLKTLTPLPTIEIFGEHHHMPGQDNPLADASDKVLERLFRDGAYGNYPVMSEVRVKGTLASDNRRPGEAPGGLGFFKSLEPQVAQHYSVSTDRAKLHGIESEIPYWVSQTYTMMALYRQKGGVEAVRSVVDLSLKQSPLFKDALRNMRAKAARGEYKGQINNYVESYSKLILDRDIRVNPDSVRMAEGNLGDFYKLLHQETISVANEKHSAVFNNRRLSAFAPGYWETKRWLNGKSELSKFIQLQVRDRDFANRIANLICKYKDEPKVVVAVGAEHIDGLRSQLERISANRAQVIDYSIEKGSVEQIICDIARVCANGLIQRNRTASE